VFAAGDRPPLGRAVPALLWLALAPVPLTGQAKSVVLPPSPLVVQAQRDLQFGEVFRGRPSSVTPRDRRAALFKVEFEVGADLLLTFLLPPALLGPGGQALPLRFGPGDGLLTRQAGAKSGGTVAMIFDPTRPIVAVVGADERVFLALGGTAAPTVTQALAAYRGTIILVVATLGT
jgi:hypothetical protein